MLLDPQELSLPQFLTPPPFQTTHDGGGLPTVLWRSSISSRTRLVPQPTGKSSRSLLCACEAVVGRLAFEWTRSSRRSTSSLKSAQTPPPNVPAFKMRFSWNSSLTTFFQRSEIPSRRPGGKYFSRSAEFDLNTASRTHSIRLRELHSSVTTIRTQASMVMC